MSTAEIMRILKIQYRKNFLYPDYFFSIRCDALEKRCAMACSSLGEKRASVNDDKNLCAILRSNLFFNICEE